MSVAGELLYCSSQGIVPLPFQAGDPSNLGVRGCSYTAVRGDSPSKETPSIWVLGVLIYHSSQGRGDLPHHVVDTSHLVMGWGSSYPVLARVEGTCLSRQETPPTWMSGKSSIPLQPG